MFSLWRSLNNFGKAIFLTFLSILIIFLSEVGAAGLLRGGLDAVLTPVSATLASASDSFLSVGRFIGSIGSMAEENRLLRDKVALLEVALTQEDEIKQENLQLRDQLGLAERTGYRLLSARVIGREPVGATKTITIDAGSAEGVSVGMPIVVSDGLLVGSVQEVFPQSARVILLLNVSVEVTARLQKSRADGVVTGQQFGQGLVMQLIPQETFVERGNRVVTAGLGDAYPPGLLIGYVQTVYEDANAIFQQADILPAVDFDRLEVVMVITGEE